MTNGDHDHPIAHFNDFGPRLTDQLSAKAEGPINRFYRLDVAAFAAENAEGQMVSHLGTGRLIPKQPYHDQTSRLARWTDLKINYSADFAPMIQNLREQVALGKQPLPLWRARR